MTSKEVIDLQDLNILEKFNTFLVLNELSDIEVKIPQKSNIYDISSTFEVSKFFILIEVTELQPENILDIF